MKRSGIFVCLLAVMLATGRLGAQTQVDLRTQGKSVDFSSSVSTKPFKTGAQLPASCSIGEAYFLTSVPSGENLHFCTSANIWTQQPYGSVTNSSGEMSPGLPVVGNGNGDVRSATKTGNGTEFVMSDSPTILTPFIGSFLNAPHDHKSGNGGGLLSSDALATSAKQGTGSKVLMFGGGPFNPGDCARFDASGSLVSAGKSCSGNNYGVSFYSQTVVTIPASAHGFTTSDLLVECYNAGSPAARIEANSLTVDVATYDVTVRFNSPQSGRCVVNGSGATFTGGGTGGGSVASVFGRTGVIVAQNGDYSASQVTNATDLTAANTFGTGARQTFRPSSITAGIKIQPGTLPSAPATGDLAVDVGDSNKLKVFNGSTWVTTVGGNANYSAAFTQQSTVVIPGSAHGFGSASLFVNCYDASTPANRIEANTISVHPATFDVTVTFSNPVSGRCVVNGSGGGNGGNGNATQIQGVNVSPALPGIGQVLSYDGTSYVPTTANSGGGTIASVFGRTGTVVGQTGDYLFAQISGTVANSQIASGIDPAKISSGLDAAKVGNGTVSSTRFGYLANVNSDIQAQLDGKAGASHSHALAGDVTGDVSGTSVVRLRNRNIVSTAPSNGQVLAWNTANNQWEPQNQTGAGTNATQIQGRNVAATAPIGGQALVWSTAASDWEPGTVSFSQISGTASNSQVGSGIDAAKIGSGTVTSTKYSYLTNVSSDIQAQLDGRSPTSHTHTLAGDVTGDISGNTVVRLRNRNVSSVAPAAGQVLAWNTTNSQWEPQNQAGTGTNATQLQGRNVSATAPASGQAMVWNTSSNTWEPGTVSGGGGTGMSSQLGDLSAVRTSSTVLTVGVNCSNTTPCNVRFGGMLYSYLSSTTVTVSGGTGTVYLYVLPSGQIVAGHNGLTLSCTGSCTIQSGVVQFPNDSLPLHTWTTTSGTWDSTGGTDRRAFLAAKVTAAGTGITTVESGGQTTISVDTAVVGLRVGPPASSGSGCAAGSWAADTSYFYVCISANTWRRSAVSTW